MNKKAFFFLFGWGQSFEKDSGETMPIICTCCNKNVIYHLIRRSEWFNIFFIPIFPYSSKHYLICPLCKNGYELDSNTLPYAEQMNELTKKLLNKEISGKAYHLEFKKYLKGVFPPVKDNNEKDSKQKDYKCIHCKEIFVLEDKEIKELQKKKKIAIVCPNCNKKISCTK